MSNLPFDRMSDPHTQNTRPPLMRSIQALNATGYQMLCNNEPTNALRYFEKGLVLAPENPILLNNLGNALVQLGRLDEAIDAYNRAIVADPAYPRPYGNLALVYQLADDAEAAMQYYQRYLALVPDDGEAHHNLGLLYMDAGRDEEAGAAFEAAARHLVPDTAERATNLGVGAFFRRDLDTAFSLFEKALSLDTSFVPARYHLGVTHLCQGRCAEAIEALEAVLDAAADYPQAAVNLAVAYNTDGQADKAIALLEALQEQQPDDPGVVLNLGFAYQEAEQMEGAAGRFRHVITLPTATPDHTKRARRALKDLGVGTS